MDNLCYIQRVRIALLIILFLVLVPGKCQSLSRADIEKLSDKQFIKGINTLKSFLTLPNYGGIQSHIDQNLSWCERNFQAMDFATEVLISDGVKHLFAVRNFKKEAPTILFYLQIDGQPVDSSQWNQESPYIPVLKECVGDKCDEIDWAELNNGWKPDWKLFARSASDSKGPAISFMWSLHLLKEFDISPDFNIKVIMDFQEELGSPTLPALVSANRDKFSADAMLIMDGTRPAGNLPTLTFGARGIATMKLTVFGAYRNLHSGHYGNFAPNPVFTLSRLLGSMKDEDGKVIIPGFYDGVHISSKRKELINTAPEDREQLLETLGIAQPDAIGNTYQESLQYPSLNVRGLRSGWVDEEVRTIIPSEAVAEIDMRLVTETPAERQIKLVTEFISNQGFYLLDREPTAGERRQHARIVKIESRIGSRPFRTDLDSPLGDWLGKAMENVFGEENYVKMQTTGGSQPIAPFITTLGIPAISVRISNPDSNIHAPDENLRLGNFHEGLKMCLGILTMPYE